MYIDDDHMYYGAALLQIAEESKFTAIYPYRYKGRVVESAFKINDHNLIYLKYASKPHGTFREYMFSFSRSHLLMLENASDILDNVFIGLICIKDRQICCLKWAEARGLIEKRNKALGHTEPQTAILVRVPSNKEMRAYVNSPGKKKMSLGEMKVARNRFPKLLFG